MLPGGCICVCASLLWTDQKHGIENAQMQNPTTALAITLCRSKIEYVQPRQMQIRDCLTQDGVETGVPDDDDDDDEDLDDTMSTMTGMSTESTVLPIEWPSAFKKKGRIPQCFLCKKFASEPSPLVSKRTGAKYGGLRPWPTYSKVKKNNVKIARYPKGLLSPGRPLISIFLSQPITPYLHTYRYKPCM